MHPVLQDSADPPGHQFVALQSPSWSDPNSAGTLGSAGVGGEPHAPSAEAQNNKTRRCLRASMSNLPCAPSSSSREDIPSRRAQRWYASIFAGSTRGPGPSESRWWALVGTERIMKRTSHAAMTGAFIPVTIGYLRLSQGAQRETTREPQPPTDSRSWCLHLLAILGASSTARSFGLSTATAFCAPRSRRSGV